MTAPFDVSELHCSCLVYSLNSACALVHFVVYAFPRDYAGRYVVRRFQVDRGVILRDLVPWAMSRELEAVRREIPPGLIRMPRSEHDDPAITEVWL